MRTISSSESGVRKPAAMPECPPSTGSRYAASRLLRMRRSGSAHTSYPDLFHCCPVQPLGASDWGFRGGGGPPFIPSSGAIRVSRGPQVGQRHVLRYAPADAVATQDEDRMSGRRASIRVPIPPNPSRPGRIQALYQRSLTGTDGGAAPTVAPAPEPGPSLGSRGSFSGSACSPPAAAASRVRDGPRLGGRGDERGCDLHMSLKSMPLV